MWFHPPRWPLYLLRHLRLLSRRLRQVYGRTHERVPSLSQAIVQDIQSKIYEYSTLKDSVARVVRMYMVMVHYNRS